MPVTICCPGSELCHRSITEDFVIELFQYKRIIFIVLESMAAKLQAESRRLYSWWWDSHISPKNSKWLQENLADTDMKVNTIIKLLEEDADSFARRAEMYYKKRPELMKLVEELYRAYRALAEKYDHATGALRQAHRTMAEAFPNQIPLVLSDESPYGYSGNEAEPHTPEGPPPLRALFDLDELQKDALSLSSELHVIKRNGGYSEPSDSLSSKKGLKQLNEMFAIGEGTAFTISEGRVRKGLHFQEEDGEDLENRTHKCSREQNQVKEKQDASYVTKGLQQDISQLSSESQNMKYQITTESDRNNKTENELQGLKDRISELISEKEASNIQYQISLERISVLESQISTTQNELRKLNDEMVNKVKKLQSSEELNQSLLLELEMLAKQANMQENELHQKQEELEKLQITIEEKHQQCMQAEMALRLKEKLHTQSQADIYHLSQEIQIWIQKLRDIELCNVDLQEEICKLKEENGSLHEQNLHSSLMIKELRGKIILIEEKNKTLEDEVQLYLCEKEGLTEELNHIKEDINDLEGKHRDLMEQKEAASICAESLKAAVKDLQNKNSELKDICKKHEAEKEFLVDKLKDMDNVLEKNVVLEDSLADASIELEVLRGKILALENLHESLNGEISNYIAEKNALVPQVEILTQDVCTLSEKNIFLENSMSDLGTEVDCLKSKLKDFEQSCQLLSNHNSGLLAERKSFLSQIEILTQNVEKHSKKNSFLENSLSDVSNEVGCLRSTLKDFEESSQSLRDQNSNLLSERNALLLQVEILTQNLEKLSDKNSFLENSLSDVSSEVGSLRSKLKDFEESCQSLSDQNSGLLAEKNYLLSQLETLNQNVEKLSENNSSLESSLSDVTTEVGCLRTKLKDSEESCESLSDQSSGLFAERNALVTEIEVLTQNMENLSHKNSFLENSLSDVNSEMACLKSKLKDLEESCQSLSNQNSGLLSERDNLLSRVVIFTQNVEKLTDRNSFLENSLSDISCEVESLRSQLKDCEESSQLLNVQNSSLLTERDSLLSQFKILTQNLEKLSDENLLLEKSLSDVSSDVWCLRSKLKDLEESSRSLTNQNSGLLAERNNLLSQLEILTQNIEKLSEKNSLLEKSLSDVRTEVGCLRSKLKESEESCQSLSDQNSGLIAGRNTLVSQVHVLTQNMDNLSHKNSLLENSLSDDHSEVECLRSKLRDFEESSQSLNDQNSCLLAEKSNLLSQVEILTQNVMKLGHKKLTLENSLTDEISEVRHLRSKLEDLEESSRSLNDQNSGLLAERTNLLSQVEVLTKNLEKLSQEKSFLENCLSDASSEVGCLKSKLKDSENSCDSLRDQNSGLLIERDTLGSQVNNVTLNLEELENRLVDMKDNNLNLSREKDLIISQVKDLQDLLKLEKEEHETHIQSFKCQLATSENHNFLLQQESQLKDQQLESEQDNVIGFLIGNFILQRSLSDVNGRNLVLLKECEKNIEACRRTEALISALEQEKLMHIKNIMSLSEQNEKLRTGICLMRNTLIVGKKSVSVDEFQDEVLIDIILGEIRKILNCVSEAEHDNQLLHLEISVLVTLLKNTMLDLASLRLDKCSLEKELDMKTKELLTLGNKNLELIGLNEKLMNDVEVSNQREAESKTAMKVFHEHLTDLQEALLTSKYEIQNLIENKKILMDELCNLREKHNLLEEEHIEVLAEALKLDHLYLFFRNHSAEKLLELKSFTYDLDSLHFIKNALDAEIDKLKEKIKILEAEKTHIREFVAYLEEEVRNHVLLSEFDLFTATCVCEELSLQRQRLESQLLQKQSQLLETSQNAQSTQQKNLELCRILEGIQLDYEADKLIKEELTQKISTLSEVVVDRNKEIRCLYEANEMLQGEIDHMCEEVKVLMSREEDLKLELQKEIDENEHCEVEIKALLSDIQVSTVNAALYEEKFHELILEEVGSLLQEETLKMEVALTKEQLDTMKKKLDYLEGENSGLKAGLDFYLALVTSLWNSIKSLEEQIMTMSKPRPSICHDKEVLPLVPHHHHCDGQPSDGYKGMNIEGIPVLEKLITKVKLLEEVIVYIQSHRQQEGFDANSNSEAASKETKGIKINEIGGGQEAQVNPHSMEHVDDDGLNDTEITKGKNGQVTKDIQLDQGSSSLLYRTIGSYGLSRISNDGINDQLWEAAETNCSKQVWKTSTDVTEHDIEPVEEQKSEYPSSELIVEKELSVDKLEIPTRVLTSRQEWTKRVLESLQNDARRLSDLRSNVKDLKRKMESSQMGKLPASSGYDTVKSQLEDAEGAVMELIDSNNKLTNKAEEYHSTNGLGTKSEESSSTGRRQISTQSRKESEKVGRLELELHKIHYVMLKFEEEHVNRHTSAIDRRSRTLLSDYIYGRRDGRRQAKKSSFCACMRPKTKGDQ
ncbi:KIP1-like protein [Musa troglodytarum]|uniref:KIP1-like protein n=3 Tax=Musa troglodytarum TaxID=320322 RepID=A0A9E7GQX4_9LILI|nr:KIP1-like protein [Musa troglodytarum]